MIEQIVEITNVGTFHGFRPEKPIELRKLTLVYGPNGTGKTTLCAILRSLARDEPDVLRGRKTLNATGGSRVELALAGGGRCVWDGTAWTGEAPEIEIYDEQFVRDNLFTDTVELDHQHNLFQVILGEQAVAIAREIRRKNEEGEETQREITKLQKAIEGITSGRMQPNDFLNLQEDAEIDRKIEEQSKKLAAHENAERLRKERGLASLPLPDPLDRLEALFACSMADRTTIRETQHSAR